MLQYVLDLSHEMSTKSIPRYTSLVVTSEPFSDQTSSLSIDTQSFMCVDFQSFAIAPATPSLEHSLLILKCG
jgi:hypothetical protein